MEMTNFNMENPFALLPGEATVDWLRRLVNIRAPADIRADVRAILAYEERHAAPAAFAGMGSTTVTASFHAYQENVKRSVVRWSFDERPTIAGLTAHARAFYGNLPVQPASFQISDADGVLLQRETDILIVNNVLKIEITPMFQVLTFEVQNWAEPDNRQRLKAFCANLRVPSDIKRVSTTAVRVIIKHTVMEVLNDCYDRIIRMVELPGTVTAGLHSEDYGSLAQGVLIHTTRGLLRTDGVDSFEGTDFATRISRWSNL